MTIRTMVESLSAQTIVVAGENQLFCDLGGEAAILNPKTGMYYGLDAVGARIWALIQQPRTVQNRGETLLTEYDVESARCERDVINLLNQLFCEGLIHVRERSTTA